MEVEEVEKYRKMYKEGLLAEIKGLIIGGVIGLIFGIMGVASGDLSVFMCVFLVYEFMGIGLGWRTVTKITDKLFGNLTIIGTLWFWFIAFIIKLCIAACIGLFQLPIFIIKTIIDYKKTMKMADEIVKDTQKSQ